MNVKIVELLRHQDLGHVKQGLELLYVLTESEAELCDLMGLPDADELKCFQALYCWAGGQFYHAMYISWWVFIRFVEFEVAWARSTTSVSLSGVLPRDMEFPSEGSTLFLKRLDLSSNRLEGLPKGLELWNVEELILNYNQIEYFDFSIGYPALKKLYISSNPIAACRFSPIHESQLESIVCQIDSHHFWSEIFGALKESFQSLQALHTLDLGSTIRDDQDRLKENISRVSELERRQISYTTSNPMMTWNPAPSSISGSWGHFGASTGGAVQAKPWSIPSSPEVTSWDWVFDLPSIRKVSLLNANINRLETVEFPNIVDLTLSGGKTLNIKNLVSHFPKLKKLKVFNRHLEGQSGFAQCMELEELVLSGCFIHDLPGAIRQIPKLRILDISFNQIRNLPHQIFDISLEYLDVWSNALSDSICEKIVQQNLWPSDSFQAVLDFIRKRQEGEYSTLRLLQLSNHYFREDKDRVAKSIGMLEKIVEGFVDMWDVFFGSDEDLTQLRLLERVLHTAIDAQLDCIYEVDIQLRDEPHPKARLVYNDHRSCWNRLLCGRQERLSRNLTPELLTTVIEQYEMGILDISAIHEVSMSGPDVTEIPLVLRKWPNLERLLLRDSGVSELPEWLADLNLKSIDVTNAPIQYVAPVLWEKCLDVRIVDQKIDTPFLKGMNWRASLALTDFLQWVCDAVESGKVSKGRFHMIDFSNTHLAKLPENISVLEHVIRLDISHTKIQELPENLWSLPLRHLNIQGLTLEHIPKNATAISLDADQYKSWKSTFSEWKRLEVLEIRGQSLKQIDPEIFQLLTLTRLDLRDNQISKIPKDLVRMEQLNLLLLRKNLLTEYPPEAHLPKSLRGLDLRSNEIELDEAFAYANLDIEIRQ